MRDHGKFPYRLRATRRKKGWTQGALAERCGAGWSKPRISRYENGHITPSLEAVETLAAVLRVDPAVLVGWSK